MSRVFLVDWDGDVSGYESRETALLAAICSAEVAKASWRCGGLPLALVEDGQEVFRFIGEDQRHRPYPLHIDFRPIKRPHFEPVRR